MKKLLDNRIIISLIVVILVFGYFQVSQKESDKDENSDGVVRILMPYTNSEDIDFLEQRYLGIELLYDYVDIYNTVNEDGVKVEIVTIDTTDTKKFITERNSLLISQNQPELIFISNSFYKGKYVTESIDDLVEFGIALELDGYLDNYHELYEGLKDKYFLPVGIRYLGYYYNKGVIKEVGGEHKIDMTEDEFRKIVDLWIMDRKPSFEWNVYEILYDAYFPRLTFYNLDEKSLDMNTVKIIDKLDRIKYFFKEEYITGVSDMTYDDFIELYESEITEEMAKIMLEREKQEDYYLVEYIWPGNYFKGTGAWNGHEYGMIKRDKSYDAAGFIVNKNSGDLDAARKFLDYAISTNGQMIWAKDRMVSNEAMTAPVNEAMHPVLVQYEKEKKHVLESSMKIRDANYKKIESGEYKMLDEDYIKIVEINELFKELAERYMFDDLDKRELENELKIIKNKYEFILME